MRTITLLLFLLLTQFSLTAQVFWLSFDSGNSGLPNNNCHDVYVLANEQVYAATSGGVGIYNNGVWTANSLTINGVLPNFLAAAQPDGAGVLWAGAFQNGISRYENGNWTKDFQANIKRMLVDSIDQKWFASTDGLVLYDGMNYTEFNTGNTPFFPSNIVNTVAEDGQGNIWIGCDPQGNLQGGLARFDGNNWTSWNMTTSTGLPDNRINSIDLLANGDMVIGTDAGLAVGDPLTGWTAYNAGNSMLPNDQVNVVKVDENDLIWVGTEGGLANFDLVNMTVFTTATSDLPDNRIRGIDFDQTGHTWLATGGGVAVYNPDGVTTDLEALAGPVLLQAWSPNPVETGKEITSKLMLQDAGQLRIRLLSLEGKVLKTQAQPVFSGEQELTFSFNELPSGLYLLQVLSTKGSTVQKIRVQ
ncbi:MAG: two-component regulator propeller domain-containing protein [Bacteroidota bacterium]